MFLFDLDQINHGGFSSGDELGKGWVELVTIGGGGGGNGGLLTSVDGL